MHHLLQRSKKASQTLNMMKKRVAFHTYFEAMDDPQQVSYITRKQAMLCQILHQNEIDVKQHRLIKAQAAVERTATHCAINEMETNRAEVEKEIMNKWAMCKEETRVLREEAEKRIEEQEKEIRQLKGENESIDAQGEGNENDSQSSFSLSSVIDGLVYGLSLSSRPTSEQTKVAALFQTSFLAGKSTTRDQRQPRRSYISQLTEGDTMVTTQTRI